MENRNDIKKRSSTAICSACYKFKVSGQFDRLFFVSDYNEVVGPRVTIWVLPEGHKVEGKYPDEKKDCVRVFGLTGGRSYGWIHHGKWEHDINVIIDEAKIKYEEIENNKSHMKDQEKEKEKERIKSILNTY